MTIRKNESTPPPNRFPQIDAFFLAGPNGRLFSVLHRSAGAETAVLFCPPFAEELNRSRRMVALQASSFARNGLDCLVVDPYGSGDSEGEFGDATWSQWLADMQFAADWLIRHGAKRLILWGLRLGAILAGQVARRGVQPVKSMILWQPVVNGRVALTQFLRTRLVADMARGGEGLDTAGLRAAISRGDPVEVAGYRLGSELTTEIDGLELDINGLDIADRIVWLEVVPRPDRPLSAAGRQATCEPGGKVVAETVVGEPFWATAEIAEVPDLIKRTTELAADSAK